MAAPVEWSGAIFVSGHLKPRDTNSDPRVTGLANGNILVTWRNSDIGSGTGENPRGDGDFGASTVFFSLYDPEGRPLVTKRSLTADYGGFYPDAKLQSYDIAPTSDGGFVTGWVIDVDQFDYSRVFWTRRSAFGAVVEDAAPTTDSLENPYRTISLVTDLRNDLTTLAVSHRESELFGPDVDRYGINVAASGAWGAGFAVADNGSDAMGLLGGEIALLGNGNVVSVYVESDHGDPAVEGWITARNGTGVKHWEVGSAGHDPHVATLAGGGFAVAWQLPRGGAFNNEIVVRLYDDGGTLTRANTVFVERDVTLSGPSTDGITSDLDLVALPQGGFYVVWIRNGTPWGRLYSAAGDAQGDPQPLGQEALALDAGVTSDGRILVTYADRYASIITNILDPRAAQLHVGGSGTGFVPSGATVFGTGDGNFAAPTVLTARPTDSRLFGDDGVNRLIGRGGNDVLTGGRGRDIVQGGGGNDTVVIRSNEAIDVVDGGAGTDLLDLSRISAGGRGVFIDMKQAVFTGPGSAGSIRNVENVSGTQYRDTIYGGALANVIRGNGGNDVLEGGGGRDTVDGGVGDDTIRIRDGEGIDHVRGGDGRDTLVLSGIVSGRGVTVDLALGRFSKTGPGRGPTPDPVTATTSITGIEAIYATQLDDTLRGNEGINAFYGQSGRDRLEGRGGADLLRGEDGDDRLIGGAGGDTLDGGAGLDTVSYEGSPVAVQIDLQLGRASGGDAAGDRLLSIENLRGGEGGDRLTGNAAANRLEGLNGNDALAGGGGNDTLDGGSGADRLAGGYGDDTLVVDNARDQVIEAAGQGSDKVLSAVSYTLAAGQEVEALQLLAATGSANLNLTGNAISQSLVGNNGANVINGGVGRDAMTGRGGGDTYIVDNLGDRITEAAGGGRDTVLASASYVLGEGQEIEALQLLASTGSARFNLSGNAFGQSLVGNSGANVLDGRGGADVLTGRGGADSFVFSTALGAGNVDRIADFAAEDTMRLSKDVFSALAPGQLAESAFKNISTGTADANDRILYKQSTGELFYDADGSGSGAAMKFAVLDTKAALTAADFLVA
ncbi:MAG: calcium-binding protein [Methylorubrum rhodinum]|uniref:calcium-binding protein n=1 Tax=Methylorubrum rhodinum TaxID=29428 RepID=UPI003BAE47BB